MHGQPLPLEARLLRDAGEIFASGLFEERNARLPRRHARAALRYFEAVEPPPPGEGMLYPSGKASVWGMLPGMKASYSYSYSLNVDAPGLLASGAGLRGFERRLFESCVDELSSMRVSAVPRRYAIGGAGYTHSIVNYRRVLREGLISYAARVDAKLAESSLPASGRELLLALKELLQGVSILHAKCLASIAKARDDADGEKRKRLDALHAAFSNVPFKPASSFYEAMLSFNFIWQLDGCDSAGLFDRCLAPYYDADLAAGALAPDSAAALLKELWLNFDIHGGWHMLLDGSGSCGPFSLLCLKTLAGFRRPNAGLKVPSGMPEELWDAVFDLWRGGSANPALYNQEAYAASIPALTRVSPSDAGSFAFGGCTELMFEGVSNVGSIDAGVNLLEVFDSSLRSHLPSSDSYESFLEAFKRDAAFQIARAVEAANLNQQCMAQFRPQIVRSLLVDDCIGSARDFNDGGARVNGSVLNLAGATNVFNSLLAVKRLFEGALGLSKDAFLEMLSSDFKGCEDKLKLLEGLQKFGNAKEEVDAIASSLSSFLFSEIARFRSWRGDGYCVPGVIMFVTYEPLGLHVGATPDGRRAGAPLADSAGAMQGTDLDGPTSLLSSCASLPQSLGIGTLVLNLRIDPSIMKDGQGRGKLKSLIQSYFKMGGLYLQVTCVDAETIRRAVGSPELYPDLMVRIGGYSERFSKLSPGLRMEILKRTEHK